MNKSTAILIFAQSAERESKLKLFLKSEVLFSELNKHTLSTVEKSGLPYFHFSEKEQNGPTFAERYVNAIQSVYDQGYDTVITIGNDTPQLTTKHLHHTVEKLQECPIVLGPTDEADTTRPIPIVNGAATIDGVNRTGVARNVVISETKGKSRYYAASFNFQKAKGLDNYSYRLNYTLSSLENDTEDINFRAANGNNYGTEFGPSVNDRRHNINGIFNYYPLKGTTVTLASLLQSGQPINRTPEPVELGFIPVVQNGNLTYVDANGTPFTTDLNGDGASFGDDFVGNSDRFPRESRNNDRLPWSFNFDLGVQHQFKLTEETKLELRADIFNVLNVENLSGYSNNATQSNQIQQGSASSGRFIQRNAGPPRQ